MRTLLLMTVITIVAVVSIPFPFLNIQAKVISYPFTEEERKAIDRLMETTRYQQGLKGFMLACAEHMPRDVTAIYECLPVLDDLNIYYDQLFQKHQSIIDKYAKLNQTGVPLAPSA